MLIKIHNNTYRGDSQRKKKFANSTFLTFIHLAESSTCGSHVKKVNPENKMFMDRNSIKECIKSIKMKNTEGYDRIPQRILVDGVD